jgi:hypothetical protein
MITFYMLYYAVFFAISVMKFNRSYKISYANAITYKFCFYMTIFCAVTHVCGAHGSVDI